MMTYFQILYIRGKLSVNSGNHFAQTRVRYICVLLASKETANILELREDDGNSNDDARKQRSDWLNEEK